MTQNFNFDVNIEKRMPDTGKMFMVDRMTSDYALAHPFDVDGFIESVHQKYEQMATEDPQHFGNIVYGREQLRRLWNLVLQMPDRGDKSLYPNQHDPQPALMEVWHKAGDFWRRGLRLGDVLPAKLPACKITRLEDGSEWIALFPKEMVLLDTNCHESTTNESSTFVPTTDNTDDTDNIESVNNQCDPVIPSEQNNAPVELDLFAQMKMELDQLREENERLRCNMIQNRWSGESNATSSLDGTAESRQRKVKANERATACSPMTREGQEPSDIEDGHRYSSPCVSQPSVARQRPRRVRRQKQDVTQLYSTPAITVDHSQDDDHSERNKKIFAAVATAVVFVVLVNTVGLFGIAALGLLAGGLIN